jgi:hypothetical protein
MWLFQRHLVSFRPTHFWADRIAPCLNCFATSTSVIALKDDNAKGHLPPGRIRALFQILGVRRAGRGSPREWGAFSSFRHIRSRKNRGGCVGIIARERLNG